MHVCTWGICLVMKKPKASDGLPDFMTRAVSLPHIPPKPPLVSWDLENVVVLFPGNSEFCIPIFVYNRTEQLDKWMGMMGIDLGGQHHGHCSIRAVYYLRLQGWYFQPGGSSTVLVSSGMAELQSCTVFMEP